jgi:class 3 adenylate cyclase
MAILCAAMQPQRVQSLVLVNSGARTKRADDYPMGIPERLFADMTERASSITSSGYPRRGTGYGDTYDRAMFATKADDVIFIDAITRWRRSAAAPRTFQAMTQIVLDVDVRAALPILDIPTLVLHRRDDAWTRVGHGRYLAAHIPGAKYVELDGEAHAPYVGDVDSVIAEIEEFVTGARPAATDDRFLATVLFTDIVGSTDHAVGIGDRRWSETLQAHDDAVRQQLSAYRGSEVNTTGDGFMATFDGPARAISCALAIREAVGRLGIEIRAGLHTGEVQRHGDAIAGVAVHIAARVASVAPPGSVLASQTVKDLVIGSGIEWRGHGRHILKGVPDEWALYEVISKL